MGKWSIAAKELIPIVLASMLRGSRWQGCLVIAHCNNLAVVEVINAGYCKDPLLMQLLRCHFFVQAHHEFSLKAIHIQVLVVMLHRLLAQATHSSFTIRKNMYIT